MSISIQKSNQLKAIAILMMICLHLFNRDYTGLFQPLIFIGEQPLSYYISLFSDACVPIFAFVSGYGLYFKFKQNRTTYTRDNWSRLKKLYINYWVILLIFAVGLGLILNKEGYPGSLSKFIGNFSGLVTSYNGAWWFFTTYVFFVLTSRFWFSMVSKKKYFIPYLSALLILYVIAFYFRIYRTDIFDSPFMNWLQKEAALYFCTLFQFMVGAFALEYNWNAIVQKGFLRVRHKNSIGILLIIGLICLHGLVPNLIVAPFTAFGFIFIFLQLRLSKELNGILDYLSLHSTNMWLIHMFFYMIFFKEFVYNFTWPPLIFGALVSLCLISSYPVLYLTKRIQRIF